MKTFKVAVVGVTGLVGQTMLQVLSQYRFPIESLSVFASSRSVGKTIEFNGEIYPIKLLDEYAFDEGFDIILFAVEADLAKKYVPIAAQTGAYVIDNSSAFRMDKTIPLIVPEVNLHHLKKENHIIANPNCSTIQSVIPLAVIDQLFDLKRVYYSTYQAVSGSGLSGIHDLTEGKKGNPPTFYPKPISDNVLPHIDSFLDSGYTKEEMKMIEETHRILGKMVDVQATCVRVPVFVGHSVSMFIETHKPIDLDILKEVLRKHPSIVLFDQESYPTPLEVAGTDTVYVGRLRKDLSHNNQMMLWCVADNVRKGAASNAVQIAEYIIKEWM